MLKICTKCLCYITYNFTKKWPHVPSKTPTSQPLICTAALIISSNQQMLHTPFSLRLVYTFTQYNHSRQSRQKKINMPNTEQNCWRMRFPPENSAGSQAHSLGYSVVQPCGVDTGVPSLCQLWAGDTKAILENMERVCFFNVCVCVSERDTPASRHLQLSRQPDSR